jgi:hypothetical protein
MTDRDRLLDLFEHFGIEGKEITIVDSKGEQLSHLELSVGSPKITGYLGLHCF